MILLSSLLIKNGTIFREILTVEKGDRAISGRFEPSDVLVEQDANGKGVISKIAPHGSDLTADRAIDGFGLFVSPGLVDTHVHFRDPGQTEKEDILTGAEAAKHGGYTTVVMMANTSPPIDNVETLRYVLDKGAKTGINVKACACVSKGMKGKELVDMEALVKAGAAGFTDDGKPLVNAQLVEKAMIEAKRLNVPISFHEEDPYCIATPGYNASNTIYNGLGVDGADRLAEYSMIARDAAIAAAIGAEVVFQHLSTKESVELIQQYRQECGFYNIHAEATPHHFTLTEKDAVRLGTLAKMNPPLREEIDRKEIISGILNGSIDLISTDHAPHTSEEKSKDLVEAPSGVIGLETAFGLAVTQLIFHKQLYEGPSSLYYGEDIYSRIIRNMSINPAQVYNIGTGAIKEGAPADIMIFDPRERWVVSEKEFTSKASNSPFIGMNLIGKVKFTICNGKIVYVHDPSLLC